MTTLGDDGNDGGNDSTGAAGTDSPCSDLLGGAFDYEFDAGDDESPDADESFAEIGATDSDVMLPLWHDERTEEVDAPESNVGVVEPVKQSGGAEWQADGPFDLDATGAWADFRARIVRKPDGTFDIAPPAPVGGARPPDPEADSPGVTDSSDAGAEPCRICGRATYPCAVRGQPVTSDGTCPHCHGSLPFWRPACDRSLCVGCDRPAEHAAPTADQPQVSDLGSCTCTPID